MAAEEVTEFPRAETPACAAAWAVLGTRTAAGQDFWAETSAGQTFLTENAAGQDFWEEIAAGQANSAAVSAGQEPEPLVEPVEAETSRGELARGGD